MNNTFSVVHTLVPIRYKLISDLVYIPRKIYCEPRDVRVSDFTPDPDLLVKFK